MAKTAENDKKMVGVNNPLKFLLLTHFAPYMPKIRGLGWEMKKRYHNCEITIARLRSIWLAPLFVQNLFGQSMAVLPPYTTERAERSEENSFEADSFAKPDRGVQF